MNRYKIIVPYQSDITHLASNEYAAFDLCYDEITKSAYIPKPKIFVVLDLTSNIPYYLEITDHTNQTDQTITKDELMQEVRHVSESVKSEPAKDNNDKDICEKSGVLAPMRLESTQSNPSYDMLEKRIDQLETELIKMKMKLDYTAQVSSKFGSTNMSNMSNMYSMHNQPNQPNQPSQPIQVNQPTQADDCCIL